MNEIKKSEFHKYYNDIFYMINFFKDSEIDSKLVMQRLGEFIDDGSAIVAGHIFDGHLKSFIWCYPRNFAGSKRLHISYFFVSKEQRGQGLSNDLLQYAKHNANELNISYIDLNVDPENKKAIKIYKKSGFKTEKLQLILNLGKGDVNV